MFSLSSEQESLRSNDNVFGCVVNTGSDSSAITYYLKDGRLMTVVVSECGEQGCAPKDPVWIDRSFRRHVIKDMPPDYRANCLRFMERQDIPSWKKRFWRVALTKWDQPSCR